MQCGAVQKLFMKAVKQDRGSELDSGHRIEVRVLFSLFPRASEITPERERCMRPASCSQLQKQKPKKW